MVGATAASALNMAGTLGRGLNSPTAGATQSTISLKTKYPTLLITAGVAVAVSGVDSVLMACRPDPQPCRRTQRWHVPVAPSGAMEQCFVTTGVFAVLPFVPATDFRPLSQATLAFALIQAVGQALLLDAIVRDIITM